MQPKPKSLHPNSSPFLTLLIHIKLPKFVSLNCQNCKVSKQNIILWLQKGTGITLYSCCLWRGTYRKEIIPFLSPGIMDLFFCTHNFKLKSIFLFSYEKWEWHQHFSYSTFWQIFCVWKEFISKYGISCYFYLLF